MTRIKEILLFTFFMIVMSILQIGVWISYLYKRIKSNFK
jgi:hypothetical protein